MGIKFACHECGKPLNIKTQLAGKRGKCPACGLRFRIPQSDQPFSIPLDDQFSQPGDSDEDSNSGATNDGATATDTASTEATEVVTRQVETGGPNSTAKNAAPQPPSRAEATISSAGAEDFASEEDFDPLADANVQWYVRPPNGGRYGPASGETVRQWVREGRVTRTTLIWRDGWTQWRDCDEIIPEAFTAEQAQPSSNLPPRVKPEISTPVFDLNNTHNAMAGAAVTQGGSGKHGAPVTPGGEPVKSDVYLGAKKRRRSRQRVTLISILAGIAVILVIALVVALAWPR